jgi:hypothetical protein
MDSAIRGGLEGLEKGRRDGIGRLEDAAVPLCGVKVVVSRLTGVVAAWARLLQLDVSRLLVLLTLMNILDGWRPVIRIILESTEVLSSERRVWEEEAGGQGEEVVAVL